MRHSCWLLASALLPGCYSGLSGFDPEGGVPEFEDQHGDAEDDGVGPIDEDFAPDPVQIRLLSAHEYANTVEDLLGIEASDSLDFGEIGSGYDNGSEGQLGESLFSILFIEAERLAEVYVAQRMSLDFPCYDGVTLGDGCAETIVDELGRRAFRRPLDAETRQQLLDLVDQGRADADEDAALARMLVVRMLMSPRFLYRTEVGRPVDGEPDRVQLDPFEIASLVSYSVTGSMPDEALLADAEAGGLDQDTIREHVRRLQDTDRGREQLVRFFAQWLRVQSLESMAQDPEQYPKLAGAAQAEALRDELGAFVDRVVLEEQGTLADVLTRNLAFANQHTAELYGQLSTSDELEALELDPDERGGVLTLASVMAVHSSSAEIHRDKPIRRGLLVKNQLLCETVGLPSGIDVNSAAEEVQEDAADFEEMTTREQLELIMNQSEVCVGCHATFMPYGYLWGNFDALGQYQTHFGDRLLDAQVDELLVDGQTRSYDGVMELLPDLVESPQVSQCFGRNVARYATGHAEGELVDHLTEQLTTDATAHDLQITTVLEDLLATPELYVREAP